LLTAHCPVRTGIWRLMINTVTVTGVTGNATMKWPSTSSSKDAFSSSGPTVPVDHIYVIICISGIHNFIQFSSI
jgi:hypothetical protein